MFNKHPNHPGSSPQPPTDSSLAEFRAKYDHNDCFSPAANILSSESNPHILCSRKFIRLRIEALLHLQKQLSMYEKTALSQNVKPYGYGEPSWKTIQQYLKEYDEVFHSLRTLISLPDAETENPLQLLHYIDTANHASAAFRRTILPLSADLGDGTEGYHDLYFFYQNNKLTLWERLENFYLEYFTNSPERKLHPRKRKKGDVSRGADKLGNMLAGGVLLFLVAVGLINGGLVEEYEEKVVIGAVATALQTAVLVVGTDMKLLPVVAAGMGFAFTVWFGVALTAPAQACL